MAPGTGLKLIAVINIEAKDFAELISHFQFGDSGKWAGLDGNIVGIVYHGHEIA